MICSDIKIGSFYRICEDFYQRKKFDEIIENAFQLLIQDLRLERILLLIRNRIQGNIYIKKSYGLKNSEIKRGNYLVGQGAVANVVENGQPIIIEDISKSSVFLNKTRSRSPADMEASSFLAVPIFSRQESIGALCADSSKGPHLEEQMHCLAIVAHLIAQVVRYYQLEEEELQSDPFNYFFPEQSERKNMIGTSKAMYHIHETIKIIAPTDTTVLIEGESGVGKELVARLLHESSPRRDKPFVSFNCAALPEQLIESELFGHEKGSFTGAVARRTGRFEQAHEGTIFLDEIGEIDKSVQVKLLRAIQHQEFERVGGSETIKVNARIISATNKNLDELMLKGEFREDLYYRLSVFPIYIPPLRERKTDIPLLANYFLDRANRKTSKNIMRISTPAIDMLMSYHWPGNVRELQNIIERAVLLSDDKVIHSYHLPPTLQTAASSQTGYTGTLQSKLDSVEYELIVEALKHHHGNMSKAAKMLGLTERIMRSRVKKYRLDYKLFRRIEN